jgi:hypothetical protein
MGVDVSLQNVTVDGDWIEGDVVLNIDELGINFSKTQHVKTKKDVEQSWDLGGGFTLKAVGTLEPPNKACIAGRVSQGFLGVDIPKQCVAV